MAKRYPFVTHNVSRGRYLPPAIRKFAHEIVKEKLIMIVTSLRSCRNVSLVI